MPRLLALSLTLALALTSAAADWPQFLGPERNSLYPGKFATWQTAPKVLWKQPVGLGHSSPVVANGVVYSFYQPKGKDADALAAFDAKTGDKKWEQSYDRANFKPPFGEGPRGTPAVAGDRVFTFGSTGVLACWDAKTGDVKWKVDTLKEFGAKNLFFGLSTSPTVVGKTVVVMVGGKGAGVVAFDTDTGKVAWQATDDPASYSTPLPVGDSLVFLTGSQLRALGPKGEQKWQFPFKDRLNESSTTPVKVGNLVIASSVTAGSVALSLDDLAKGGDAKPVWKDDKLTCYFSTPVAVGDHLYMVNGAATLVNPSIVLRCVDPKTGKVLWTKDKVGKYHAALVTTGDGKLFMLDDGGNLIELRPNGEKYEELRRAKVCGDTWAHPALSDGRMVYVRDAKELVALQLGE